MVDNKGDSGDWAEETAFEQERRAGAAGLRAVMENAESDGQSVGGGFIPTGAAAAVVGEGSIAARKKKEREAFAQALRLVDQLRDEAARWDARADEWAIERDALQLIQDREFLELEELDDILNAEVFDAEKARQKLAALGVEAGPDDSEIELRRALEREVQALRRTTEERQAQIDDWNVKIDQARNKADALRAKAEDYEHKIENAAPEEAALIEQRIEADLTLVREMVSEDVSVEERHNVHQDQKALIKSTGRQLDETLSFDR